MKLRAGLALDVLVVEPRSGSDHDCETEIPRDEREQIPEMERSTPIGHFALEPFAEFFEPPAMVVGARKDLAAGVLVLADRGIDGPVEHLQVVQYLFSIESRLLSHFLDGCLHFIADAKQSPRGWPDRIDDDDAHDER